MTDRLDEKWNQDAIGIIGKLPVSQLEDICNGKLEIISNQLKAAELNPRNPLVMEILMRNARIRLDEALKSNLVEFNGVYFEKEVPRDNNGYKVLYSRNDSIKRVNSFGARHAYPSELFSWIIAGFENKLNAEQKIVADDIMESPGEWLYPEIERKKDKLVVYFEGSTSLEFDVGGIPSRQSVDLWRFPEEFIIKMYSRRFEDLPERMKVGDRKAQVYLPPSDGIRRPLGRGNFYHNNCNVGGYGCGDRASRGVVRENFFMENGRVLGK